MDTLVIWQRLTSWPGGAWAFSRLVCLKAPYFGSIRPLFTELRPGYCAVQMRKRRAVHNHLGSVHAIAMCNMAELAGGVMTDVTIPATHRWIPMGMTVRYLRKATTNLVAVATPVESPDWSAPRLDYVVKVVVQDAAATPVFDATITMRVSPKARAPQHVDADARAASAT